MKRRYGWGGVVLVPLRPSSLSPQSINRVHAGCLPCRVEAGNYADDHADNHPGRYIDNTFGQEEIGRIANHGTHHGIPDNDAHDPPDNSTNYPEYECLVQKHPPYLPGLRANREQYANLLDAFTHRHHHNVKNTRGSDQQGNAANGKNERSKGAQR